MISLEIDRDVQDYLLHIFYVFEFEYTLLALLLDIEWFWELLEGPGKHKFLQSCCREIKLAETLLVKLFDF